MKYIEIPFYDDFSNETNNREDIIKKILDDFVKVKNTEEYNLFYIKENPLVTIMTTTYNRKDSLINYSLNSILNQTYKNLEIIVVGDKCTDGTNEVIRSIEDDRLTFINLLDHPPHPTEKFAKWFCAGSYVYNLGKQYFTGDFLTHLDDDDIFTPDRIEKLVKFAQETKADAIHHPFINVAIPILDHKNDGLMNNSDVWWCGNITTSAVFLNKWLAKLPANPHCWKINEPGDWHIFKRILEVDSKIVRFPETLTIKTYSNVAS